MGIKAALPKYELYFYYVVLSMAMLWAASWILEVSSCKSEHIHTQSSQIRPNQAEQTLLLIIMSTVHKLFQPPQQISYRPAPYSYLFLHAEGHMELLYCLKGQSSGVGPGAGSYAGHAAQIMCQY